MMRPRTCAILVAASCRKPKIIKRQSMPQTENIAAPAKATQSTVMSFAKITPKTMRNAPRRTMRRLRNWRLRNAQKRCGNCCGFRKLRRKPRKDAHFHCSHAYRRVFRCLSASGTDAKFPRLCTQLFQLHCLQRPPFAVP